MVCKYFLPCRGSRSPSMFHFGLIFGEVKKGSKFIFFFCLSISKCPGTMCWKTHSFPVKLPWHFCQSHLPCRCLVSAGGRAVGLINVRLYFCFVVLLHLSMPLVVLTLTEVPSPRPLTFLPLQAVQGGGRGITMRPQWLLGFISLQGP